MPLEHVVYINLDHRADRRTSIEAECAKVGLPTPVRFPAVQCDPGSLGCTLSHLGVLRQAKAAGWDHVLVLEDDFTFQDPDTAAAKLDRAIEGTPYDVLCLGYVVSEVASGKKPVREEVSADLDRIWPVQTTVGYLVHHGFYDTLIANFQEAARLHVATGNDQYCVDQHWRQLQPDSKWYCFRPRLGRQLPGYSDIEGRVVDYEILETISVGDVRV